MLFPSPITAVCSVGTRCFVRVLCWWRALFWTNFDLGRKETSLSLARKCTHIAFLNLAAISPLKASTSTTNVYHHLCTLLRRLARACLSLNLLVERLCAQKRSRHLMRQWSLSHEGRLPFRKRALRTARNAMAQVAIGYTTSRCELTRVSNRTAYLVPIYTWLCADDIQVGVERVFCTIRLYFLCT